MKCCSMCKEEKECSEFYIKTDRTYRSECMKCSRNMCKKYKKKNKNVISDYNSKYKANHKAETTVYNRIYTKTRKKIDPVFKMKSNLRTRIYYALNGKLKYKTTPELLGCEYDFLKSWFEYQFNEKMNFQNQGSVWHIDHVIPCSKFNLIDSEEQKRCFHWSNLKPMVGRENILKTNNIKLDELLNHELVFTNFLMQNTDTNFTIIEYNKLNYINNI